MWGVCCQFEPSHVMYSYMYIVHYVLGCESIVPFFAQAKEYLFIVLCKGNYLTNMYVPVGWVVGGLQYFKLLLLLIII